MQMQMQMQMNRRMMMMAGQQPGGKPPKPPRHTFPAAGDVVRMELVRKAIRFDTRLSTPSRHDRAISVRLSSVPTM